MKAWGVMVQQGEHFWPSVLSLWYDSPDRFYGYCRCHWIIFHVLKDTSHPGVLVVEENTLVLNFNTGGRLLEKFHQLKRVLWRKDILVLLCNIQDTVYTLYIVYAAVQNYGFFAKSGFLEYFCFLFIIFLIHSFWDKQVSNVRYIFVFISQN